MTSFDRSPENVCCLSVGKILTISHLSLPETVNEGTRDFTSVNGLRKTSFSLLA